MAIKAVLLVAYIFTFVVGFPSNLLACYAFLRKVFETPSSMDILLINLTVSDLLFLLFLPFKMAETASDMVWSLPVYLCPLTNFCFYSSIYLSTLFLTAVSVERYLCVAYPVRYRLERRLTYAIAVSLLFWLLAYSHCSVVFIVEYHNRTLLQLDNTTCYEDFSPNQLRVLLPVRLELSLVLFLLPFAITLFCYISVIRILASLPNIQPQRKQRAVGLAFATLLNFAICFGPLNISHIVGFIQNQSPSWRPYAFILSSFNTILDPVVFYFSSSTIRQKFAQCWFSRCLRLPAFASHCTSWCFREAEEKDEEAGAGRASISDQWSGSAIRDTPHTVGGESSLAVMVLEIRAVSTLQLARFGEQQDCVHTGPEAFLKQIS
uniref:Free fatty acid receptor 3-like n=1 Tax=Pogona vitticeps TaxID=103695 RepID=A0A6J0VBA1_9SAUR